MSRLIRSMSFGRRKKKPSNLHALTYLTEQNKKTDNSKLSEAIDLYNKINTLDYETNFPSAPNKHQQDITRLSIELENLDKTLLQKREELSKLKSVIMFPSVPKDITEQKIQKLKAEVELLELPEQMMRIYNLRAQIDRKIEEAKNKLPGTIRDSGKIKLAEMKQELNLLLQDEKINDMFQRKLREQIQEDEDVTEATDLLKEHGIEGGKRRKKRKTKKNKKNKTKKTKKNKKNRKGKKYTRK